MTITVMQEGQHTRVTLIHSGWAALPPSEQGVADPFGGSWGAGLEKLKELIETGAGRPYPHDLQTGHK